MTQKDLNNKSKRLLNIILIVLVVLLSLVQIFLSNRIATWGKHLKDTEEEIVRVQEDNFRLELEIVSNGRLHQLAQEAKALGFIKNPPIINLTSQVPVALKPLDR